MRRARWIFATLALVACSGERRPAAIVAEAGVDDAGRVRDATSLDVKPVDPCGPAVCGPAERCGPAGDGGAGAGNGVDDDCDGLVDEGCACVPGEARACFDGPPDRRGVGACRDGIARCTELAAWVGNECRGATLPATEACNGRDDDCDGAIDEGVAGCASSVRCPASFSAAPLAEFTLAGRSIAARAGRFAWSVECPAGVAPCPTPAEPSGETLRVAFPRAGIYRVTLTLDDNETCRFPVYVQGRGLRVELDWDRKGGEASPGVDLDLHLAPIDRRRLDVTRWFTPDDCYFQTCKAPGGTVQWGTSASDPRFAPTPGSAGCAASPPPYGDRWVAAGRCWNPRLDVDNITCDPALTDARNARFCFPENAAVDDPPTEVTFRVLVNFYRDHGTCADSDPRNDVVHPVLSIHCGGIERAAVGSADDGVVPMRCADNPAIGSSNWSWLAADVRFVDNACGARDCRVTPLRVPAGRFVSCSEVRPENDACQDALGRVFVRRAGARPVDTDLAESP